MAPAIQTLSPGDPGKQNTNASRSKPKDKERKAKLSQKSQTERLKTVVRRLPPNLPEDIFWQSVQPWVTDDTITWRAYYPGKFRKRLNKENVPSRAYIAFKSEDLLATFNREYDGHIFRDKAGNESIAVVEFAPFQKIPSDKKKVDSRMGTIEKDEDFISFLESLKEVQTKTFDADTLETLVASTQPAPAPTTTPLLEALRAEKSAQKDKEAIQRNHAHYKDPVVASGVVATSGGASRKEDAKKKAPAASLPAKSTESQAPKKASRKAIAAAKAAQQEAKASSNTAASSKGPQQSTPTQAASSKPTPSSPTPKASRGHRDRQASKSIQAPAPPSLTEPLTITTSPTSQTVPIPTPAPAPRRTRPVLGLGSRQFEAALSGAGVAISAADRKARRERDRQASVTVPADSKSQAKEEARSATPTSRQATSPTQPVQPTPIILQRDGQTQPTQILPRPVAETTTTAPSREDATTNERGRGRGRARRGRGGRGGA